MTGYVEDTIVAAEAAQVQEIADAVTALALTQIPTRQYTQPTRPTQPGPWLWWVEDPLTGQIIDLVTNDGES